MSKKCYECEIGPPKYKCNYCGELFCTGCVLGHLEEEVGVEEHGCGYCDAWVIHCYGCDQYFCCRECFKEHIKEDHWEVEELK